MADAPTKKRPNIRDIAEAAGVSRATVSRVINGGHWVSGATQEKVDAAIAASGYTANPHARSLAGGRSGSVAFILEENEDLLFSDPTFERLLRSVTRELVNRDLVLMLMLGGTKTDQQRLERYVTAGHIDGVLLISPHLWGEGLVAHLQAAGVPMVLCGRPMTLGSRVAHVAADDRDGARQAVTHLIERGRRRVAMIAGPADTPGGPDRLDGYRDVIGGFDPDLVVVADQYTAECGRAGITTLIERGAHFDGLFAASDVLAVGAMDELRACGRSIPDDVAVVGFDDNRLALTTSPPLTTMRQPFERIAHEMVRVLVEMIDGGEPSAVILPTDLVQRQST